MNGTAQAERPPSTYRLGQLAAALAVLAFATALRLRELGELSAWLDEAITWERATLPLPELFADSVRRNHVPSYFVLMHYWLQLGDGEWIMRFPSVVFGVLRVAVVLLAGSLAGGFRVGVLSALIVSLSPEQLRYDQEARMYAQLGLFTAIALSGVLYLLDRPEARARPLWARDTWRDPAARPLRLAWLAVVIGTAGSLYTHNIAVFVPVATSAAALCGWLSSRAGRVAFAKNWLASQVAVLVLWAPWLRYLLQQTQQVHSRFWAKFPSQDKLLEILADVYAWGGEEPAALALISGLFVAGVVALRRRQSLLWALLALSWLTPIGLLLISLERPMFISRLILWTGVPWAILLAYSAKWLRPLAAFAALCALVTGIGLYNLDRHYYGQRRKPNWKAALTAITTARRPDAIVLLAGGRDRRQVHYYLGRASDPFPAFDHVDVARKSMVEKVPSLIRGRSEVWVVHRGKKGVTKRVVALLRRRGRQTFRQHYGHSLHIRRFAMRNATR